MSDRSEKLKEYEKTAHEAPSMTEYLTWCKVAPACDVQSFPIGKLGELDAELERLHLYCDDLEAELKELRHTNT